jgi:hypothetical protein
MNHNRREEIFAINFNKRKWSLSKIEEFCEINKININKYNRVKREYCYRFEIEDYDRLNGNYLTVYNWIKEGMYFVVPKESEFYFNAKFNY